MAVSITKQKIADYPIPSGRFQRYTLELFKSGFMISWFDRFPVAVAPAHDLSAVIDQWRETLAQSSQDASETESEVTESLLSMALVAPVRAPEANNLAIAVSAKAKTRHKWECPKCGDSFMGKPSLNMICGKCNVKVVDRDAEKMPAIKGSIGAERFAGRNLEPTGRTAATGLSDNKREERGNCMNDDLKTRFEH
ncbi:hypothetical protein O185_14085 [Photorhabdus temperata J3]|uniref:Uncharacterized protein n=1 Tax=Photorhabdus temperata J3 TaxID=1389415 RepID=U7QXN5_PHOTE|nr:hypothetical protein O185_14085 [Photorhabdus temperata J3]